MAPRWAALHDICHRGDQHGGYNDNAPALLPVLRNQAMATTDPRDNHLLAAFPEADWQRLRQHLEWVCMPAGMVLYEAGAGMSHVFFPTTCVVSLMNVTRAGQSAEIAAVGNDGVVGVSQFMGGGSTTSRAVVQSDGEGYRLKVGLVDDEFKRGGAVPALLLLYTQTFMTQVTQTAACNRHHTLVDRLSRSLLACQDRIGGDSLQMTQKLIGDMLGVRREAVTDAALYLQQAGMISYARGHIRVLDRRALERRSCECYAVVKNEYKRLLPQCVPA